MLVQPLVSSGFSLHQPFVRRSRPAARLSRPPRPPSCARPVDAPRLPLTVLRPSSIVGADVPARETRATERARAARRPRPRHTTQGSQPSSAQLVSSVRYKIFVSCPTGSLSFGPDSLHAHSYRVLYPPLQASRARAMDAHAAGRGCGGSPLSARRRRGARDVVAPARAAAADSPPAATPPAAAPPYFEHNAVRNAPRPRARAPRGARPASCSAASTAGRARRTTTAARSSSRTARRRSAPATRPRPRARMADRLVRDRQPRETAADAAADAVADAAGAEAARDRGELRAERRGGFARLPARGHALPPARARPRPAAERARPPRTAATAAARSRSSSA